MIYIYFFPSFLCVSGYVYASVCDFVCIALLLAFVLGFCLSVFSFLSLFLSTSFNNCYHWWICFFGLDALFFLSFNYFLIILIIMFYFLF